jgi:hypothetical protein
MHGGTGRDTESVTEVEFAVHDTEYLAVDASERVDCVFELAEMVPREDGRYAEFFNVSGADPERVRSLASGESAVEAELLREYDDGGLFEMLVGDDCPALALAELGALPREVTSEAGECRIVAEIPPRYDAGAVVETFVDRTTGTELLSKREKSRFTPLFSESAFRQVLYAHLTDRQREVLEAAFEAGYYEWPRECTGAEVADRLGIASSTFSEHIHAAERKLLTALFDGP